MSQNIINFEFVEAQLQELKNHFLEAGEVIENLVDIQTRFEKLAETYQIYKKEVSHLQTKAITTTEQIKEAETKFEHRFSQLEKTNEFKSETFNTRISVFQNELNRSFEELATQLGNQVNDINKKFEERLANFQSMPTDISDLQNEIETCKQDLISLSNKVKSQSEASVRKLNKSVKVTQRILIIFGLMWLILLVIVLIR
jgi:DNA repair ATPase RecN